jgi:hypothetical protein
MIAKCETCGGVGFVLLAGTATLHHQRKKIGVGWFSCHAWRRGRSGATWPEAQGTCRGKESSTGKWKSSHFTMVRREETRSL